MFESWEATKILVFSVVVVFAMIAGMVLFYFSQQSQQDETKRS